MSAVWHEVLWEQLLLPDKHTWELCSPGNGFGRRTKTAHLPQFKPPQTLPRLFGSDCMCINAYIMVFGAQCVLSDLCAESCDSWLLPLVYSLPFPPSCEAASGCQPEGDLEPTEMFNKCLWVRSSQVIASSCGRARKCTPAHRRALYSQHLILRRIDSHPPPTNVVCSLPEGSAHTPICPPLTFSSHLRLNELQSSAASAAKFALLFSDTQQSQLNHVKMVKRSFWKGWWRIASDCCVHDDAACIP